MSELRFFKIETLHKPEKRPSRFSALLLWMTAAVGLVVSGLLAGLFPSVLEGMNPFAQQLAVDAIFYLPFVALPVFLLAKRTPGIFEAYRPNPISLFNVICIVILALLGVFLVNDITVLWSIPMQKLGLDVFVGGIPAPANTQELILAVCSIAVIPAICEEFMFRGAVLPAFEGYGTRRAMLVSALLFATLHGSIVGLPAQLLLGVILAVLVFWTDSIYAGLIYHTVHNSAILMLEYVQNQAPADPNLSDDLLTLLGGAAGAIDLGLSVLLSGFLVYISLRVFFMRGRLKGIYMEAPRKEKLVRREVVVLAVGIALCAVLYGSTLYAMLGGGA